MSITEIQSAPEPRIERLANGMRAVFLPSDANSIVALALFYPLPGAIERPEEAGIVGFTHRMLMRGTRRLGSAELAEAIERLGTSMSCDTTDDFSYAHFVSTSDTFAESLELLAEVLQKPAFEPEEIEKERQSTLASIRRSEDDKFSFTFKRFIRELYGDHSYGLPRTGTVESVAEFKREQIAAIHGEFLDPGQFLAVCVGNFDSATAAGLLESLFKPLAGSPEPVVVPRPSLIAPHRVQLSRDCEQSFLCMGVQACGVDNADFPAMRVMNTVVGEGMSSRLFVKLRDEQGLAYATGSSFSPMRHGGHFFGFIGTKPESLDIAREGMLQQFDLIKDQIVPADELQRSQNYIVGKFLIDHQTNFRRAYYLGSYEMLGLGMAMDETYPDLIRNVTAGQVQEVARKYLKDYTVVELIPGK